MIDVMADTPAKPRRRWLSFSLRALLLAMLLIGGGLGWVLHIVRQQGIAVAALEKMGCQVDYAFEEQLTALGQLREILTDDDPRSVFAVTGSGSRVTDEGMARLRGLTQLKYLSLIDAHVTDAGLTHIRNLTQLTRLELARSRDILVYSGGWVYPLNERVDHMQVTDAGLVHLQSLHKLEFLDLGSTLLTDAGLAHLQGLHRLNCLHLDGTRVTDAGLSHLQGPHELERLHLDGTLVTDAGLVQLQELPQLQTLSLENTPITDAGLVHLRKLKNLCHLYLRGTQVTTTAIDDLNRALPNLTR